MATSHPIHRSDGSRTGWCGFFAAKSQTSLKIFFLYKLKGAAFLPLFEHFICLFFSKPKGAAIKPLESFIFSKYPESFPITSSFVFNPLINRSNKHVIRKPKINLDCFVRGRKTKPQGLLTQEKKVKQQRVKSF